MLKQDTADMLSKLSLLNIKVFISSALPPVGKRENSSKALSIWLSTGCTVHSVHFIAHFNLFWDQRHLTKLICLNKTGVKKKSSPTPFHLLQLSVPYAKRKRQGVKTRDATSRNLEKEQFHHTTEKNSNQRGEKCILFPVHQQLPERIRLHPPYFSDLNDSCTMMW